MLPEQSHGLIVHAAARNERAHLVAQVPCSPAEEHRAISERLQGGDVAHVPLQASDDKRDKRIAAIFSDDLLLVAFEPAGQLAKEPW